MSDWLFLQSLGQWTDPEEVTRIQTTAATLLYALPFVNAHMVEQVLKVLPLLCSIITIVQLHHVTNSMHVLIKYIWAKQLHFWYTDVPFLSSAHSEQFPTEMVAK